MYYLLGMDDRVADLDAMTAVRMFLLYSKDWAGAVAERVKAELQSMRLTKAPTNLDLITAHSFDQSELTISHCEMCAGDLGTPAKFVEAYTHWKKLTRMCMHCSYFLSPGIDLGDGAIYMAMADGQWRRLHGRAQLVEAAPPSPAAAPFTDCLPKPKLRYRLKFLGRRVVRKCVSLVRNWIGRPG
jgi:hypothetical protein